MVAFLDDITGSLGTTSVPIESALANSDAIDASTLTTQYQLVTFTFPSDYPFTLVAGHNYAITIEYSGGDISNYIQIAYDTQGTHVGNLATLSGTTWTAAAGFDLLFVVGGTPSYKYATTNLSIGAMISIGSQFLVSYKDNANYSTYGAQGVASVDLTARCAYGNLVVNVMGDQDRNKTFEEWALNYRVDPSSGLSMYTIYKNYVYASPISPTNLPNTNYNKIYGLDKIIASSIQMNILFKGNPTSNNTPVLTSLFVKWNENEQL